MSDQSVTGRGSSEDTYVNHRRITLGAGNAEGETEKFNSEALARLLRTNPAVYSALFGIAILAFLDNMLSLWPGARSRALPYLSIPAVAVGGVGWGIGTHTVLHPSSDIQTSCFKRTAIALLEGLGAIFVFILGEEIRAYCLQPNNIDEQGNCRNISDVTFLEIFIPAPVCLSAAFIIWNIIPLLVKGAWALQGKAKKALVVAADSLCTALLYSRNIQMLLMNISFLYSWQPLFYEGAAVIVGLGVLGVQTLKPEHRQKLHTLVIYIMTANLIAYLVRVLIAEFSQPEGKYAWSPILKATAFPLLFVAGVVFIWRHASLYVKQVSNYVPDGNLSPVLQQQVVETLTTYEARRSFMELLLGDPEKCRNCLHNPQLSRVFDSSPGLKARIEAAANGAGTGLLTYGGSKEYHEDATIVACSVLRASSQPVMRPS